MAVDMPFVKRMKTNTAQSTVLVDFLELHPEMVTHLFVGLNAREKYKALWAEVASQLNSMGFGGKSTEKWIEAFTKWKSKVKGKAQDIKCGMKKNGGGGPLAPLTSLEERLMTLIGWKTVDGDQTEEIGLGETNTTKIEAIKSTGSDIPPLNFFKELGPSTSTVQLDKPQMCATKRKRRENIKKANSSTKADAITLQTMHSESIEVLREINNNVLRLAVSHERQTNILEELKDLLS